MTVPLENNTLRIDSPLGPRAMAKVRSARLIGLRVMVIVGVVCCGLGWAGTAIAQEDAPAESSLPEVPLYDQEAYDLITLDKQNKGEVLKVEPLRRPVSKTARRYEVRLWDEPEKVFEVRLSSIEKIELFEELVLAKAIDLVKQGDREQAFDYFRWLEPRFPKLPGLKAAIESYLYGEAGVQMKKGDYYGALAILVNLHDRNPEHPNLQKAMGITEDKLISQCDAAGDYSTARALLRNLRSRFPDHPMADKWESEFRRRAGTHLADARQAMDARDFRKADRAMQKVVLIWPDLPGVDAIVSELHQRYPRVVVGVKDSATNADPRHRQHWATRRGTRLLYRTLTEFLGPGSEGGDYRCPVGSIDIEPLQHRLVIQLHPGLRWATGRSTLTGADVARQLLAMAEPGNEQYRANWSELFAGATVRDVYQVDVQMRRPHVRPDALLQTALAPFDGTRTKSSMAPPNGPYVIDPRNRKEKETVYISNRQYFAATPTQPKEIVEVCFQDDREAIRALRDGQIKVLDRLDPWTLDEFRSVKDVVVEPYAAPLVHCLIPNMKKPLMAEGIFRRALVYGIHRRKILEHLLGGQTIEGCTVISGPFPQGTSYDDPLGYAYDTSLEPRAYEPVLAIMLATYAVDSIAAAKAKREAGDQDKTAKAKPPAGQGKASSDPKKSEPKTAKDHPIAKITLAYPPDGIARTACQKIKEQLKVVGITVILKELPPGPVDRVPNDVDLLYAELPIWEPVVDSRELLASDGPSGGASAYMSLVLRRLRRATDWQQVRPILHQVHNIAHNDVAVIPLWQLIDHFAYHKSLKGIGQRPVSLYQNVEQWRLTIPAPPNHGTSTQPAGNSLRLAGGQRLNPILTQTSAETK
ncbi:MAG: hypothetical protein JW888_01615 [Pirellulales bacterium]|nr:hypothetical protein [Pirellulales bacterium]